MLRHNTLPLDKAILYSIEAVGDRPDIKKRIFSSIVLVGASALFEGLHEVLEDRCVHGAVLRFIVYVSLCEWVCSVTFVLLIIVLLQNFRSTSSSP